MDKIFLYIDILGFTDLVENKSPKVQFIFETIDKLKSFKHFAFNTIVFSDTILIFNNDEEKYDTHYYITFCVEFVQELFYNLALNNIYFKALITKGEFHVGNLENFQFYYGNALIEAYKDSSVLNGFGLFVNKAVSKDVIILEKISDAENKKYDSILLCDSFVKLNKRAKGLLPVDLCILSDTDEFDRIEEDLSFFRKIAYLKEHIKDLKIKQKYETFYDWYKKYANPLFDKMEENEFMPFALNSNFIGRINPYV